MHARTQTTARASTCQRTPRYLQHRPFTAHQSTDSHCKHRAASTLFGVRAARGTAARQHTHGEASVPARRHERHRAERTGRMRTPPRRCAPRRTRAACTRTPVHNPTTARVCFSRPRGVDSAHVRARGPTADRAPARAGAGRRLTSTRVAMMKTRSRQAMATRHSASGHSSGAPSGSAGPANVQRNARKYLVVARWLQGPKGLPTPENRQQNTRKRQRGEAAMADAVGRGRGTRTAMQSCMTLTSERPGENR
jgi:hypothetical protein